MTGIAEELTAGQVAEIRSRGINFEDIPELTEEDFARGHFKCPGRRELSFRIDDDNLDWLQSDGTGDCQQKMNRILRWAREHGCPLQPPPAALVSSGI